MNAGPPLSVQSSMERMIQYGQAFGQQASGVWSSTWSGPSWLARLVSILVVIATLGIAIIIVVPLALLGLLAMLVIGLWRALRGGYRAVSRTDGQGRQNVRVRQAAEP